MLLQSVKTRGGRTIGRGMKEQERTVWLLSIPACSQVNHVMRQVSGICYDGTIVLTKIMKITVMIMQYILLRSPFCPMKELINIHTGEVAGRNVNADEGYKIGLKIIESTTGVDIDKFIF